MTPLLLLYVLADSRSLVLRVCILSCFFFLVLRVCILSCFFLSYEILVLYSTVRRMRSAPNVIYATILVLASALAIQ